MTDRLKFRVWDKENNKYHKSNFVFFNNISQTIVIGSTREVGFCYEDCAIEQCTGQKDKNGKLIYEGDIVRLYKTFNMHEDESKWYEKYFDNEIYYSNKNLAFKIKNGRYTRILNNTKILEVVGNIHQNPELLKNKYMK